MNFCDWCAAVDSTLKSNRAAYRTSDIDEAQLQSAFDGNESPVIFAKRTDHIGKNKTPTPAPKPIDQSPEVLSDPKYLLDTGLGVHCPICGSTFVRPIEKSGTGLGYLGSIGWVIAGSMVESAIKSAQVQPLACGYCQTVFTAASSANQYAEAKR